VTFTLGDLRAALVLVVIAAGGFVYTRSRKIKD